MQLENAKSMIEGMKKMSSLSEWWESTNIKIPEKTRGVINQFLLYEKHMYKSQIDIRETKMILENFFYVFLTPLDQITAQDVLIQLYKVTKRQKPRVFNIYHSAIERFFQFCKDNKYVVKEVVRRYWKLKVLKMYFTKLENFC